MTSKRTNKTRFAILGMLTIHPMSGYDIKQMMQTSTNYFWSESDGQLYPILAQLNKEELILCEEQTSDGGRKKKIYSITQAGRDQLKAWLMTDSNKPQIRHEFLLKLFFGNNIPIITNLEHLEQQKQRALTNLKNCERAEQEITQECPNSPDALFWLFTTSYGKHISHAQINWCDETIKILNKLKQPENNND